MSIFAQSTTIWLKGLFAAGIGAFSTAAMGCIALPTVFNVTSKAGWANMVKVVAVPALYSMFAYLKQSPLPGVIGPGDKAVLENPVINTDGTISATSGVLTKAPDPAAKPVIPQA